MSLHTSDITPELIRNKIYWIRGKKVMLDRDLALLYGVPTKRLNEAVKRNILRFPNDFMFQLTSDELELCLRSQIATLNNVINLKSQFATSSHGGARKPIWVFTEQGIAMLSSVLNSEQAIRINIQIIRIFTQLREMIESFKELRDKIDELEQKYDSNFKVIFDALRTALDKEEKPKHPIGFRPRD